jgi:hypothetical protein
VLRNKREEYTGWVQQYYELPDELAERDDADLVRSSLQPS